MPGRTRTVKVLKSAEASGSAAAVFGRMRTGRARNSHWYRPSKMFAAMVREYRSEICAGSNPVSAMRNE